MEQDKCSTHIGIEKEIDSIKEKQHELRQPSGPLENFYKCLDNKVDWKFFIWVMVAIFSFIAIMQTLMYRSIDDTNRKIEKLNDLVVNRIMSRDLIRENGREDK